MQSLARVVLMLILYALAAVLLGVSAFPGVMVCVRVWTETGGWAEWLRLLTLSICCAGAYFVFGFLLILSAGVFRVVCRLRLREGEYPLTSPEAIRWFVANGLQTLVTVCFMDFILLTPFATFFYRVLGARVGRQVQINSKYCADASLLEIGDGATIGGHATVIAHSFERGQLILKRVRIGRHVIIGLNAIVLPGAEIGNGAIIAAGAIVPKDARVAPQSMYFGPRHGSQHALTDRKILLKGNPDAV